MKEELKALKDKFNSLQKTRSTFKLSERTVVDIIQKIMARKKINLVHTISGTEYLTLEKLSKEIQDTIKKFKGRISKIDLQKQVDIQSGILEERLDVLLKKDSSTQIIEGNIITNYYLESISNEIDSLLSIQGNLFISDLSTKYDLSMDYIKKFIDVRTRDGRIRGRLFPTRVITDLYIESQTQKLRPLLISSICPVPLQSLIETYNLDDLIIHELIDQLIDSGTVKGKVSSGIFYPSIFEKCQEMYIKGALSQNNYLEYSKLSHIGIKNAKSYLKSNLNLNGIYLTDYFISENLKVQFESVVQENLQKNFFVNLNMFNFDLNEEDLNTILLSINIKPGNVIYLNNNLISKSLIENSITQLKSRLKEYATAQYNTYLAKKKELDEKKKEDEKSKRDEDEDEENTTGKKDKGGKKKSSVPEKKNKKGGKKKGDEEDPYDLDESSYMTIKDDFKQILFKDFEQLTSSNEDINSYQDTIEKLFEDHLYEKCQEDYTFFIKDYIQSMSKTQSGTNLKKSVSTTSEKDPKNALNRIENGFHEIKHIFKTIDSLIGLSKDKDFLRHVNTIIAHILRTDVSNLFKEILLFQLVHMKHAIDQSKDLSKYNDRNDVINKIDDPEIKQIFSSLNKAIQEKNYKSFLETLSKNCINLAISISPNDKKKEKLVLKTYRDSVQELINEKLALVGSISKKDNLGFLIDVCQLVLHKKDNYIVKLPYENWSVPVYIALFSIPELNMPDAKAITEKINQLINLKDGEYESKMDEISDFFKKFVELI